MTEPSETPRRPHRGLRRLVLAVVAACAAAVVIVLLLRAPWASAPSPAPTPSASPEAGRPLVHLTPESAWMNDPQRPFWLDGEWHMYYLFNADYPDGNGTAWYHATSDDLVHWENQGVAIEKYRNGLGDVQTGSVVVDTDGTAGFGRDAVIAIATQQDDGVQRQSMFVSADGGYTFADSGLNPVLDNPGAKDFRDPKIVWDDASSQWLMVLAEGERIGFYRSDDLRSWEYLSDFARDDLGTLECPDLFVMTVDGDPDRQKWILLTGANGSADGRTTGTAYWTGEWDGTSFTPDADEPQWLDDGADYYAAVTWDDPRADADARLAQRYALGWLNNWSYAGELAADGRAGGSQSITREIALTDDDGTARLVSRPVDALPDAADATVSDLPVDGTAAGVPQPGSAAYRARLTVERGDAEEVRLRIHEGDGAYATVGVDFGDGGDTATAFVMRDADADAASLPEVYRRAQTSAVAVEDGSVTLDVVVDTASVEVFSADGRTAISSRLPEADGREGLSIQAVGGEAVVRELVLTDLAAAP